MTGTSNTTTTPSTFHADAGPVLDAIRVLVERSTLADHVTITAENRYVSTVAWTDILPVTMAGSGTAALWDLAAAIATSRHTVSLYEVVCRLHLRNRAAVAAAVTALCAGVR